MRIDMDTIATKKLIEHVSELAKYGPPDHSGTVNVRLSDKSFSEKFEMVFGKIDPGCEAHRHSHETEHQTIYVVSGIISVSLGEEPAITCEPGSVIRIPPKLDHHILNIGTEITELIIIYSPPLPSRADTPI